MSDKTHSKLGASSCERWFNCPGSVSLSEQAPEQKPSKYAAEGTVAHAFAANLLQEMQSDITGLYVKPLWSKKDPIGWCIGEKYYPDGIEVELTLEMHEAIKVYADYVESIIKEHKLYRDYWFIEHPIKVPGNDLLYGTADCIIHVPFNKLVVIDFKYGAGHRVPVASNKQLLYYALGAYLALPEDDRRFLDRIEMVIVQPRCKDGPNIDNYFVHPNALLKFHEELLIAAEKTKPQYPWPYVKIIGGSLPSEPFLNPGDWCKWCPAKAICPALKDKMFEGIGLNEEELMLPTTVKPTLPPIQMLTPETVGKILDVEDMVIDYFKALKHYGATLINTGTEVPGYRLEKKLGNRRWKNLSNAQLIFEDSKWAFETKLLSPAQIEKQLKIRNSSIDLAELVERPDNGYGLVKVGPEFDLFEGVEA